MQADWQSSGQDLQTRLGHLLDAGLPYADVQFLVGQPGQQESFSAHKLIFCAGSSVFEAMFRFEGAQQSHSPNEAIRIPDVTPAAFRVLRKFLYTERVEEINRENVMDVFYAAEKYAVSPRLSEACLSAEMMRTHLDAGNVFEVARYASLYNKPKLLEWCLQIISMQTASFDSSAFLDLDRKTLADILKQDLLGINEFLLFKHLIRWTDRRCEERGLDANKQSRRKVLGELLELVRFPLMTESEIASTQILDKDELHHIYVTKRQSQEHVMFSNIPRYLFLMDANNGWDIGKCHTKLVISGNRLNVRVSDTFINSHSEDHHVTALAEKHKRPDQLWSAGIFYFEIKVIQMKRWMHIGLASKKLPLTEAVGNFEGTFSYKSHGQFWGHNIKGAVPYKKSFFVRRKPTFGEGDVIGCGIKVATGELIYTKNGERIDTSSLLLSINLMSLYPAVSLLDAGDAVEANFGGHLFLYDITREFYGSDVRR